MQRLLNLLPLGRQACMSDSTASAVPSPGPMPGVVKALAAGFFLVCLAIQIWRLESLSATYDQALFLQELWSTAQGRPFESSLSSVLSAAVKVDGELPSVTYLHLGQHANFLTLLIAPLVALLGSWALPLVQVGVLTAAGLVLWRIAARRLPASLAIRITAAYYLSGAVIGPALENFHDLIWLPLLGFLVVEALLEQRWRQLVLAAVMLLLVREDSGLVLFSLGLWALVRQPGARWSGVGLMASSFLWVLLVTGWIQPAVDSSLSDRFLQEKFGHLVDDVSGGTLSVLLAMLRHPLALLQAIVSPPGATLGFLLALSLAAAADSIAVGGFSLAGGGSSPDRTGFARSLGTVGHAPLRAGLGARSLPGFRSVVAAPSLALVEALDSSLLGGCSGTRSHAHPGGESPSQPLGARARQFFALGSCLASSDARTPRRPA